MHLVQHLGFFVVLAAAIVLLGTFYGEPDDAAAFRALPRRFGVFLGSCALVALVMLACEHLFASL